MPCSIMPPVPITPESRHKKCGNTSVKCVVAEDIIKKRYSLNKLVDISLRKVNSKIQLRKWD